tara:strand:- start:37521 stop:37859 length:339 start_codon:yes stop_codon:yes gene_type:complete
MDTSVSGVLVVPVALRTGARALIGSALETRVYYHVQKMPHIGYALLVRRLSAGYPWEVVTEKTTKMVFHDGIHTCPQCGSRKVLDRSLQTRSADEGMTHFFHCTACHHKWKT